MTTKQIVLATLVGAAALGAAAAWLATRPSDAQPKRGNDPQMARAREAAQDPQVPMLHGLPTEASAVDHTAPLPEVPATVSVEPEVVEEPAWPTPENLRAILDARGTTEAILGAIEGVNQALRPRVPVRLVNFDSGYRRGLGELRAESSITLDATTRALSELKVRTLGAADFWEVNPTAAKFRFREAPPAQGSGAPPAHDTWEPAEPGEDLTSELVIAMILDAGVTRLGPTDSDPSLKPLELQRRQCDFKSASLSAAMSLVRKLDAIRGVRVTRVQWKTDDSTGEVSATCHLTLRLAEPPK